MSSSMIASNKHRRAHWLLCRRLELPAKLCEMWIYLVYNSFIPAQCEIGEGAMFGHKGIDMSMRKLSRVGKNCMVDRGVIIGGCGVRYKVPAIGDNCHIGADAKAFGPIVIGDNAMIGTNAVTIKGAPFGSVWGCLRNV